MRYDDQPAPDPARCFDCPPVDPAPAVQWSNLSNLIIVVCLTYLSCVVGVQYFPFDQGPRSSRSADAWALPSLRAMAKVSISSLVVVGAKEIIRSGKLYDESVDLPAVINGAPQAQRRAAGANFWPNHFKTGGFPCILATQATAQPPLYPISWTDPTDPARRPSVRPAHRPSGPLPWAPLGLGLTALRGSAPPGPLCFLVFVFSRPPAASDPPGRALNGESKTLRPGGGLWDRGRWAGWGATRLGTPIPCLHGYGIIGGRWDGAAARSTHGNMVS